LRRLFAEPHAVLDELRREHGPVFGLGAGPVRLAVVGDPDALRDLFATPSSSFRWGHRFNVLGFVVGEGSMIVSDGPDHERRRSSVRAAFTRRRLNGWIPMILGQTDVAVDRLAARLDGHDEVVDLYPVGRSLVLGVAVRALFGPRLASRTEELGQLFERPQAYLEAPAIRQLPHRFPFTARARARADRRAIDAILDARIAEIRRSPTDDPLDVLEALVFDGKLSDAEIRDQVVSLIGAGYNTTAAALSWMLWRVTLTPGMWARLREEAVRELGPWAPVTTGDAAGAAPDVLARLVLADQVVHESLRLHPASVFAPRQAICDLAVAGHRIRAGTLVMWSAHLAGREPSAWPDPLRFDPDRFVARDAEARARTRQAWVPFGQGARNCIGFALAQMELTLIIARLAQRLDVSALTTRVPDPVGMVVCRPGGGAPMRVAVYDVKR